MVYLSDAYSQARYVPLRIQNEIKLDGKLDEPVWQKINPLSEFMQTDPTPGADATERTDVRMLYNDEYLFVGFSCHDKEPQKLISFFMDRDFEIGKDDGISIALDTYNDKSTGIVFITNTLSARFDSELSNNGGNMNDNFNTFWDAVSAIDSTGYTSEFRIPFSSLRFEQKEKVVMGFRFARMIKRKNELITYPRCDSSLTDLWDNLSQAAELEFSNLKTKKPIYFTPYVIGNYNRKNVLNENGTVYEFAATFFTRKYYSENEALDKILSNLGADFKYGITKNFTLNLTLNTDFAQAEVDNRIINLSKYEVNLPEKRNFFLESQNYMSYAVGQSTKLFNSRTIGLEDDVVVPIIGGARLTGKQNGLQFGVLDMQTAEVKSENIVSQNFGAARFRKFYDDKGSFWGGIFTNRISTQGVPVSYQSVAIDMVHHFNDKWMAGFGTAVTYDSLVKKTIDKNTFINLFAFKNSNEGLNHGFDLELVGDKFDPAMGFNAETDYGFISLSNGISTKIKGNHAANFWKLNTELSYRWKFESQLTETKFANINAECTFKKGSYISITPANYKEDRLFENWNLNEHITIPSGYYYMFTADADFVYDQSNNYSVELITSIGDFYGGKIYTVNPSFNFIFNKYFRLNINYELNHIKFPDTFSDNGDPLYVNNLFSGSFSLTLSSKFSVKFLAQYDDDSDSFGGNLRIRYNPREGTDLYIVYNSSLNANRLEAKPKLPLIDQQAVVIKYSKTFGL